MPFVTLHKEITTFIFEDKSREADFDMCRIFFAYLNKIELIIHDLEKAAFRRTHNILCRKFT